MTVKEVRCSFATGSRVAALYNQMIHTANHHYHWTRTHPSTDVARATMLLHQNSRSDKCVAIACCTIIRSLNVSSLENILTEIL